MIKNLYKNKSAFLLCVLGLSFVGLNIGNQSFLRFMRWDITENQTYTLSDGMYKLLYNIQDPIQLKFFFSDSLVNNHPALRVYGQRVRDFIKEIALNSNGKIKLSIIDPVPYSSAEDQAVAGALTGLPVSDGQNFYFGMTGENMIDGVASIPFFSPDRESFLEYDIAQVIDALIKTKRPHIALISSLPLAAMGGNIQDIIAGRTKPYALYSELENNYELTQITGDLENLDTEQYDAILIAHPPAFGTKAAYRLDRYLMQGGRIMAFLDPYSETSITSQNYNSGVIELSSGLGTLLKKWTGVEFDNRHVVLDKQNARRIQLPDKPETVDYLAWLGLDTRFLNMQDVLLSNLKQISLATAGHFIVPKNSPYKIDILMRSSKESDLIATESMQSGNAKELNYQFSPKNSYILSAKISGQFKTAFPQGIAGLKPASSVSLRPANLIVVGDTDMLEDRFWLQTTTAGDQTIGIPFADNGNFILNSLDFLSNHEGLNQLRGRVNYSRPFTYLENIRKQAEDKFLKEEQRLSAVITETQNRLHKTQGGFSAEGQTVLSQQEQQEVDKFKVQLLQSRQALREVQKNLNTELQSTQTFIKILNIGIVPLTVSLGIIALSFFRRTKFRLKGE